LPGRRPVDAEEVKPQAVNGRNGFMGTVGS
jgi:hypothetical protein